MNPPPPAFSAAELRRIATETFVAEIRFHPAVSSTNDLGLELAARSTLPAPTLILTTCQTAGRGRGVNRWWSGPGALTFSLVLDSAAIGADIQRRPQVSLTAAVAVCKTLKTLLPQAEIGLKWPNDVLLETRKVSGILVEVSPRQQQRFVLGIGVNVNNAIGSAPQDVAERATSLIDVAGHAFDLTGVLICLLQQIEQHLTLLASGNPQLPRQWQVLCLLRGRPLRLQNGPQSVDGICEGLDDQGALVLRTDRGVQRFWSGVVVQR